MKKFLANKYGKMAAYAVLFIVIWTVMDFIIALITKKPYSITAESVITAGVTGVFVCWLEQQFESKKNDKKEDKKEEK